MKIVWKSNKRPQINFKNEIFQQDLRPFKKNKINQEVNTNLFKAQPDKIIEGERFIPTVIDAKSAREELICLLKLAAEIEHILLIQYLYTAYSIVDRGNIKSSIMKIAKQEMGHLLAVQNLLLRVGGMESLHLHSGQIRSEIKFELLPYTLEPLSQVVLAKYVAVEAPIDLIETDENIKKIREIAIENAQVSFNPVGGIYEKIFWLFQKDNSPPDANMIQLKADENFPSNWHIDDNDFIQFIQLKKNESEAGDWVRGEMSAAMQKNDIIFSQTQNQEDLRIESLKLVNDIAIQGERSDDADGKSSHFELFLSAYDEFIKSPPKVLNVPSNPFIKTDSNFIKNSTKIENSYSILWCNLFNKIYTSLLLDIYASFFYKQFELSSSLAFVNLVHLNMSSLINILTKEVLFKLPRLNQEFVFDKEPRCAPTFEIEDSFILSVNRKEVDNINLSLLTEINEVVKKIKEHPDFVAHAEKSTINVNDDVLFPINSYCVEKESIIAKIKSPN